MRFASSFVVIAVALGVAACNEDTTTEPAGDRSLELNSIGGSAVTGTVVITDNDGENSTVEVTLSGLDPNTKHAGHVHAGSCASQGGIVTILEPVTADSEGNGTAVSTDVPDEQLTTGFYVQYHVNFDPPGAPVACGDIGLGAPPPTGQTGY